VPETEDHPLRRATDHVPDDTEALGVLTETARAAARKDDAVATLLNEATRAVKFYRRAFYVVLAALLICAPAVVYTAWGQHQNRQTLVAFEKRSDHNQALLVCAVNSTNIVSGDVRILILSNSHAPPSAYGLPVVCKAAPQPKPKKGGK
jgi:hypothetical protein